MFKILTAPGRGVVLEVSDDAVANGLELYLKEQRYVLFERRPEASCIRFLFGEAGSETAVDELVQAFLKSRE